LYLIIDSKIFSCILCKSNFLLFCTVPSFPEQEPKSVYLPGTDTPAVLPLHIPPDAVEQVLRQYRGAADLLDAGDYPCCDLADK